MCVLRTLIITVVLLVHLDVLKDGSDKVTRRTVPDRPTQNTQVDRNQCHVSKIQSSTWSGAGRAFVS